ncbi:ROK family protein [Terrabacter sp. MAHUQ-38]|uniref:ROK family protein n=1 Tax=unclassified Terrabacter TaxID=2630222 RepID=UPI00165D6A92|nr:ROK family protein [Terrabacter sp. MAHUQ-38]MBC9820174.1 ROK family protein [Terrabacter sp. MAHUQ-38]
MANLRQASLRHANLALVARTVLGADVPPSRADVAAVTSLTRSTVSRLVDDLVAGGVLEEVASVVGGPGRPGRPATPLRAATGRFAGLGLQVGVGHLAARLVDLSGTVLAEHLVTADLAGSRPAPTLRRLRTLATRVLAAAPDGCRVVGAGLALPGIVDTTSGHLLSAPNLGWEDVDPGPALSEQLGDLPLRVGNEADLAAHAFAAPTPGRHREPSDFVYLSGEVGIGGAVVVGAAVMTGRHGWAGEIGHVCVDPDGPACRCGSTGCLEQYAGRLAMLSAAGLGADTPSTELARRAHEGDERACAAVQSAARALGIALAGVVNVLDIPTVVLGGHLAQVGDLLAPEVDALLGRRVLSAHWVSPTVVVASDDPAPGATGAALLALQKVVIEPACLIDA